MSHTPGPWTAKPAQHNHRRWCIWREGNAADRACIAETAWWLDSDPPEEEAANAHLIATAPELLEVLEAAIEWIDAVPSDTELPAMPGFDRDWAEMVIAKAKGEA